VTAESLKNRDRIARAKWLFRIRGEYFDGFWSVVYELEIQEGGLARRKRCLLQIELTCDLGRGRYAPEDA
jgi:hypothetical protein